jgi:hypothetical protein
MPPIILTCHPSTPTAAVHHIDVRWQRDRETLSLTFGVEGDLGRLLIPATSQSQLALGLWEHTCFEAFVAIEDDPAYYELNFSPSGEWAAFAFERYRELAPLPDSFTAPAIDVRRNDDRFELAAVVRLSPMCANARLRLALSAVVEESSGALSYWSLHHPPGKPDFHHADAFALRLEPPAGDGSGKARWV